MRKVITLEGGIEVEVDCIAPFIHELENAAAIGDLAHVQILLRNWEVTTTPDPPRGPPSNPFGPLSGTLVKAVENNRRDIVTYLLDYGFTCGHYAVSEAAKASSTELLQIFIDHQWDINEAGPNMVFRPILRHALANEPLRTWLLSHGADPNVENNHGITPLETAVMYSDIAVVRELIAHGGQPIRDNSLHYAAERGSLELIQLLLDHGANIQAQEYAHKTYRPARSTRTVLESAIFKEKGEVLSFLLAKGADPELKDVEGRTAMEFAKEMDRSEMVAILGRYVKQ